MQSHPPFSKANIMVINAHHLTKSGHHLEAALVHVLIDPCLWFQQCRTVTDHTLWDDNSFSKCNNRGESRRRWYSGCCGLRDKERWITVRCCIWINWHNNAKSALPMDRFLRQCQHSACRNSKGWCAIALWYIHVVWPWSRPICALPHMCGLTETMPGSHRGGGSHTHLSVPLSPTLKCQRESVWITVSGSKINHRHSCSRNGVKLWNMALKQTFFKENYIFGLSV